MLPRDYHYQLGARWTCELPEAHPSSWPQSFSRPSWKIPAPPRTKAPRVAGPPAEARPRSISGGWEEQRCGDDLFPLQYLKLWAPHSRNPRRVSAIPRLFTPPGQPVSRSQQPSLINNAYTLTLICNLHDLRIGEFPGPYSCWARFP